MSEPSRARSYRFHPHALAELVEETERLRVEDLEISRAFEHETLRAIQMLLDHPESAPVIMERNQRRIRSKVLKRFPLQPGLLPPRRSDLHPRRRPSQPQASLLVRPTLIVEQRILLGRVIALVDINLLFTSRSHAKAAQRSLPAHARLHQRRPPCDIRPNRYSD